MEFIKFINDIGFEKNWIMDYSLYLKEDNKNIIHLDCNVIDFYILYSIYFCFSYRNNKIIYVSTEPNETVYYFNKLLEKAHISSDKYFIKKNIITFFNGSFIEIIPLTVITNNTLNSDLLIIDIHSFNTKIGEYIIYNTLLNEKKNFDILCSVKNIQSSFFFYYLITNNIDYGIPIISNND